jgi:tetratricopeptide (TPR) repeat protein
VNNASNRTTATIIEKADRHYWKNEFEMALLLADKALALSVKLKDYYAQAESLLIQMKTQMSLGNSSEARKISDRLLSLVSKKCSIPVYINALIESGYLYQQYLEYKKAEELTVDAIILARDNDLIELEADALVQLATLDRYRRNFKEALIYIREAQKITQSSKRQEARIETILEKGLIFSASGDYEKALDVFEETETDSAKLKLYDYQVESILCRGDVFRATGDIDKAERLYDKALDISDKHGISTKTAGILKRVGYLLLHRREYEKALKWYAFAEEQITRFNSRSFFPFVFLGYGTAYNGLENYKKALGYFLKALDLLAPDYLVHADILRQIMEQLELSFRNLRQDKKGLSVLEILRRIDELVSTGVDSSHKTGQFAKIFERDLSELLKSIKSEGVSYFARAGVQVHLKTGAIYRDGKHPESYLSEIQLAIFNLLVKNESHPVNNRDIIGCYEKSVDVLEGVPRRAHYYIREIRKKLNRKGIIQTVKGAGYMISPQ